MDKTDTFREEAEAILKSSINWVKSRSSIDSWDLTVTPRIRNIYTRLKIFTINRLQIKGEVSVEELRDGLIELSKLLSKGKKLYEKKLGIKDDLTSAFYIEMLEVEESLEKKKRKDYSICYYLLAIRGLVEFEKIIVPPVTEGLLLEATNVLLDASIALELGTRAAGDSRTETWASRFEKTIVNFSTGIKFDAAKQRKNTSIREQYLPAILAVQKRVDSGSGVSESFSHALHELGRTTLKKDIANLKKQYYIWKESPDGYLPSNGLGSDPLD